MTDIQPAVVDESSIARLAERYLEPHQPSDKSYRLNVNRQAVRRDDDWWYVVVEPDKDNVYSYEYYGRLAEAEIDMQERENVKVLLVPALPG